MRNFKSFLTILLGAVGVSLMSTSCSKEKTCKCDLEDNNGVEIEIVIKKGKCEDVKGEFTYSYNNGYGNQSYSYDIEKCS